jgi:hypothetical protein
MRALTLLLLAFLFAAGAAWTWLWAPEERASAESIPELAAADEQGRVRLAWNPQAAVFERAAYGVLEADEGGRLAVYRIPPAVLRGGALEYIRQERDVRLSMRLFDASGEIWRYAVYSVASVRMEGMAAPAPVVSWKERPVARSRAVVRRRAGGRR